MKLKDLFKNSSVQIDPEVRDVAIRKIQYDSRKVEQGDLFIAVKGFSTDGHKYLESVAQKGAVAAVVNQKDPVLQIPQIVVENSRAIMPLLAYNLYKKYIDQMTLVGITGTNGKTTCSYLVRAILEQAGISCGLAGTIHYIVGARKIDAWNTTPEAVDLFEMLADMQKAGNKACVLEVSSHALALNRVDYLQFDAAVFTNLSRDHMDFHPSMEDYFAEKSKLFSQLKKQGSAITNSEDAYGAKVSGPKTLTFAAGVSADISAVEWQSTAAGTQLTVDTPSGEFELQSALIGDFNVYNLMAAIGVGVALNIPLATIKKGLEKQKSIPGRLQTLPLKNNALAVIDYAHTPDALEKAMTTVRKIAKGRIMLVFGCGGDRDKGKRPQMGRVAQKTADVTIVTDDNPRTENAEQIITDILAGMDKDESVKVINDRREAITFAVKNSRANDVIVVAGKGHETYQLIGKIKHTFDEIAIIREADNA